MGKLVNSRFRLQRTYDPASISAMVDVFELQINQLAEGRIEAHYNSSSAAPTSANLTYIKGDFVRNTQPVETGSAGSKYIVMGWLCVTSGSPGTFVECRAVTDWAGSSPITASLGANVALNNTANYFDGPSVAQGTAGTWFVSGTVSVIDTAGGAGFHGKLWDGTTVIATCLDGTPAASNVTVFSLSGFITSPAGNLRISVKDVTSTSGLMRFNQTGNSKDCTITAIRIA